MHHTEQSNDSTRNPISFPKDFIWGTASAAFQVEGAFDQDGRGLSTWDVFAQTPGRVWQGHNAEVACDHYHRYKEDVALIKKLGIPAYRFSIAWTRVLPSGIGPINQKGLDFYDRLIDELLAQEIVPYATLFHWDFPYDLFCKGGWLNRDSADWFANYTKIVVDAFSDRMSNWMTFNEPNGVVGAGHEQGVHAPGLKLGKRELTGVLHNILRAHGKSVKAIREHSKTPNPEVCFVYAGGTVHVPKTDTPANRDAARSRMFGAEHPGTFSDAWWMDPIYLGSYPKDELEENRKYLPDSLEEDLKEIFQPLDYFGVNIYRGHVTEQNAEGKAIIPPLPQGTAMVTATDLFTFPFSPLALYWGPLFYHERYKLPICITENGMPNNDWIADDGKVHDEQRIDFLKRYLSEFRRAGIDGVPIKGYFLWTLMDNFEWNIGYRERFGITYVDFETLERTPKESAYWYRDVIARNNLPA